MKTKLLLPFLLFSFFSFAQLTAIPDPEFERYLIGMGFDTTRADNQLDGFAETERLGYVTHLYLYNEEFQIRDFTGIEDCVNLEHFVVSNGEIVHTLDVSQNVNLSFFSIDGYRLELDLTHNINLIYLELYRSEIDFLDLSNNTLLQVVGVVETKIKELDVSQLTDLITLNLVDNVFLESMNVSLSGILYNPQPNAFYIDNSPLLSCIEVLDVGVAQSNVNNYLWQITRSGNYNFSLDCNFDKTYVPDDNFEQALIDLGYDDVLDNFVLLTNIDNVLNLNLANKNISDLTGIEGFPSLQNLNISENNLKELDLSTNKSLVSLNASSNQLQTIDVKNGNNNNFTSFNSLNNPDLFCVKSDNPSYSTANWTQIDANTAFGDNCIKAPVFFTRAPILPIEIDVFANNFTAVQTLPNGLILDANTGFLRGAPTAEISPAAYSINYQKNNQAKTAIVQMEVQKLEDFSVKSLQLRGFYSSDNGQFNINEFFVYSNDFNVGSYKNGTANSYHVNTTGWCDNGIYPLVDSSNQYRSDRNNPVVSPTNPVIYTVEISQTDGFNIDDIYLDFGSFNNFVADFELYISEDNENWIRYAGGKRLTTWTNNPDRDYNREDYEPLAITSFTHESGTIGTEVTITGTNFDLVQKVTFGGIEVEYTIDSHTQITAVVNENVPGGFLEIELNSACDYLKTKSTNYFLNGAGVIYTEDNLWSNGVGAIDENVDVLIRGDLETEGEFYAKNLIIAPGGSVKFSNGTMKLSGNLINNNLQNYDTPDINEQADAFVLEDDAQLIQTNPVNENQGEITVIQTSRPIARLDYTFWSSPVDGQGLLKFSPHTLPNRFYTYETYYGDFSNGGYEPVPVIYGMHFSAAKGYLIRAPNNWPTEPQPYIGKFQGKPISGNFQIQTITVGERYTSLGNPYPSNISPEAFLDLNPQIYTLYFWNNPDSVFNETTQAWEYVGTKYVTFNQTGSSDPELENKTISVGQGFIVQSAHDIFQFNNSIQTNDAEFFFKNRIERHRFWLNLSNQDSISYSKILVGYLEGATHGFDNQLDSEMFGYEGSAIYNIIDEEKFVIQARGLPFEVSDVVQLGFKAETAGKFNISLDRFDGLFAEGYVKIYLNDKELNIQHNLIESAYTFESIAGEFKSRFEVVYETDEVMNVDELDSNEVQIYTNKDQIVVSSKSEKILSVELFDLSGRNIFRNEKVNSNYYEFKSPSKGVLVIKVHTQNGEISTKKLINN